MQVIPSYFSYQPQQIKEATIQRNSSFSDTMIRIDPIRGYRA